jgi:hypothetical protein
MKKSLLLILFIASLVTTGFSQFIKQGTVLGGGAFEYRSHKDPDGDIRTNNIGLMPWGGYLVADNIAVGALLNIGIFSQKNTSNDNKASETQFLIGPVARYYLDNGLFVHGHYAFGSLNDKQEGGGTTIETKYSRSEFRIGAGYAARISDTVLFEPIVGYLSESIKDKDTNVKNTEGGFFIMAGFTIFFRSTN